MEDLKKNYEKVINEKERIINEIHMMDKYPIIRKYRALQIRKNDLIKKQKEIQKLLYNYDYDNCEHVLINIFNNYECSFYGCIKCGLHDDILVTFDTDKPDMFNYLSNNYDKFKKSKIINKCCDLDLAQSIYKKIIENHLNIDDDILIRYFENALNHIRNVDVNKDRKENRAKRLCLNKDFNNW